MHKESGHTALDEMRSQWRLMTVYERFEQVVAITLSGVMSMVIVISLIQLIRLVFTLLVMDALNPLDHKVFQLVFGATMALLYGASTLYHALPPGRAKQWVLRLVHAAIHLSIAGNFTPFALSAPSHRHHITALVLVWLAALAGCWLQLRARRAAPWLSTALHVAMGWVALLAALPLMAHVPAVSAAWLVIGGAAYTAGVVFFVMDSVVRSMEDYINFLTPQFSRTHINFQRVPTVDTSNPFAAKAIPSLDESFVVIHFRNLQNIDFPWLLAMLQGSFISHMNTLVVPGGKMGLAMELIMTPLVERLMEGRKIG